MKKKKLACLMIAGMLSASLLSGCSNTTASPGQTTKEEATTEETGGEISLESIAKLNGLDVSGLNTASDEDGNISFIGNKISEDTIKNEDEAATFVEEKLSTLLHLDQITLSDGESYSSPNSGITYYRFNQTLSAEIEAKMPDGTFDTLNTGLEYLTNSLKLGVDSDGYPVVLASDISYDEPEVDVDNFLSPEDAESVVATVHPDVNIYSDSTALALWKDSSASTKNKKASAAIVYLVYGDNPDLEEDSSCSPYICYEVRADGDVDNGSNGIVAELAADSLSTYSYTSVDNTSLAYFDDMEDAGEYTYTVNFDWMSEQDRAFSEEYVGKDSLEITVPVMHCKTDGLYYLGSKEHYITMSNALDFCKSKGDTAKMNPYVTDDPENPDSWHFEKAGNEEISCSYEDDPDYVLASFAEYVKVINTFGENFGMYDSYPSDSYMLLTYDYRELENMGENTDTYPTDLSGFMEGAANTGQTYDWNTFLTSPNCAICLDDVVMCHEFTHGVNSHFTNAQYANETGAVMESLADMVGYQMAAVYLNPQLAKADEWLIGGSYGQVQRSLSNPLSMNDPEYRNGTFYANTTDSSLRYSEFTDNGGVHQNSLVPSYLGSQIVMGSPEAGEKALTVEESLKMWFEVLYISNYSTDFASLGVDLKFAAKALGFSEEEQAYVSRLIQDYGFADGTVDAQLLEAENSKTINIKLNFEDETVGQEYLFCDFYADALADTHLICGGYNENKEQNIRILEDTSYPQFVIYVQNEQQIQEHTAYMAFLNTEAIKDQTTFHVKKVEVPAGEKLTFDPGESVENLTTIEIPGVGTGTIDSLIVDKDDSANTASVSVEEPEDKIVVTKAEGAEEGEYNLYIVSFE